MNWRVTAVLFVILVLLGGYVLYNNQQAAEETAASAPAGTAVPPAPEQFSPVQTTLDAVQGLGVTDRAADRQALFVRAEDGAWTQTVPTNTVVLSQTMDTLLTGLINMRTRRTLAADANPLSAYGLEAPAYEVSVASLRAEQNVTTRLTLLIGSQTPAGDAYYMQVQGDPRVHLVPVGPIDNMIGLLDEPPLPTAVDE